RPRLSFMDCRVANGQSGMNVLYYWKDYESDIRQGRIGYFRSAKDKLDELQQRSPDDIWVVKTPRGYKGQLQLLGRLVWADSPTTKVIAAPGESLIHYRPDDPRSVWFDEEIALQHLEEVTSWLRACYPSSLRANFQGGNGQLAIEHSAALELRRLTSHWPSRPFADAVRVKN
ncbi:MAG: hypothetical protein ACP5RC_12705, partial [Halothiobacillaceae bacterium]